MKNDTLVTDKSLYNTLIDLKNILAEKSDSAKAQAMETITELLEDLDSVKTASRDYAKQYVKSYPLKSLGVALAGGFILGKFIL